MTDTSKEPPELLPCPFCGGDAGDTYYQLGWFIFCKHCSASTEVTNAKARAVEAWNRRAPAVPVPQFNHTAKRKLNILLGAGEEITGYAFQNKDGRRGSIDCHGFVAWWQDAAAPQPPEAGHIADAGKMVAAPVQLPENLREGEPYDNPAFEALAHALGVWGTAQSAVCAQFWIAAKEQST